MREVHVQTFNGPLDLLLQLIEQQELDISQISLAKVTEQYLAELQKLEELPADELADFLVVAAKLLVIKSRLMVPGEPVDDEVGMDLERQLKMYQAFVEATKHIAKRWNTPHISYARDGYKTIEPIFNPPEGLHPDDLRELYANVLRELEPIIKLPQTVMIRTINIRHKIEQVKNFLVAKRTSSLHDLLKEAKNRTEAIVTFLAVLELVKQRTVRVNQNDLFGNVHIHHTEEPTEL